MQLLQGVNKGEDRDRFRKILPREHLNGLGGMCDNDLQLIFTEER